MSTELTAMQQLALWLPPVSALDLMVQALGMSNEEDERTRWVGQNLVRALIVHPACAVLRERGDTISSAIDQICGRR